MTDDDVVPDPTAEDLALWGHIRSHAEFGEATAAWLEGKRAYYPTYAAPGPDEESSDLIQDLATLNRLGFVTDGSQPGVPLDDRGSAQRAYVTGYCDESTAARIAAGLCLSELIVLHFAPDTLGEGSIVVTVDEGQEYTWLGRRDALGEADLYRDRAGDGLAQLILDSWELHIMDPVWGRNGRLLPAIIDALRDRS